MRHKVKAYVWRSSRGHWAGQVTVNGSIVHMDGTGSWAAIYAAMHERAGAFDLVANAGYGTTSSPAALRRATKEKR